MLDDEHHLDNVCEQTLRLSLNDHQLMVVWQGHDATSLHYTKPDRIQAHLRTIDSVHTSPFQVRSNPA